MEYQLAEYRIQSISLWSIEFKVLAYGVSDLEYHPMGIRLGVLVYGVLDSEY